jgi:hypothetical protein
MRRCDLAAGDTLERFLRGELPREEARRLVRHLLTRCPACLPATRRLWGLGDRPPREDLLEMPEGPETSQGFDLLL